MNRAGDWMRQARGDLRLAIVAKSNASYDWSCFAAQQASEKALKAVFVARGDEAWGHSVSALMVELGRKTQLPAGLVETAKRLDKHYIPTRYPNGFDTGAPTDLYTEAEARAAINDAQTIIEFCSNLLG